MAIYAVQCEICGKQDDQWHRMPPAGGLPALDPCACGGQVRKLVTQFAEVGTGNRMHHIVDKHLSRGADPMVFNTRDDWKAEMARQGVRPMESGEARDAARFERERTERYRAKSLAKYEAQAEKAIEKAMETIGGAP